MARLRVSLGVLLAVGLFSFHLQAEVPETSFQGKVLDPSHAAVAGARIHLVAEGQALSLATVSDDNGNFSVPLTPGTYAVTIVSDGFRQFSRTVTVTPSNSPAFEAVLQLKEREEMVTVTEAAGYQVEATNSATKTDTAMRDIPQTVNVISKDLLVDQNAASVAEAMRNVPGVSIAQGEGNRDQVVLRGISTASDFFVNGIRDDQERFRDLYNVEAIDVVQGPAAVLFGRGGAGGVVNLVTRRPMRGAPSNLNMDFGNYGRKRATTQVGAAFGPKAAFALSAMGEDSGGFRDAFFLHRYGFNPTVRFDVSNATGFVVGFEHLKDRRLADRGIPSQLGLPANVRREQLFGSANQNRAESGVDSVSATLEHRFTTRLAMRNNTLAGKYGKYYQNVYPGSAANAAGILSLSAYNRTMNRTNAFNQTDVTYDANLGRMRHRLLFGTEFGHQFQDELRHNASSITNVSLSNSVRDANFAAASLAFDRHATSDIAAGYAQDQISLADHWKAVVGARLDWFRVNVDNHLPGVADFARTDRAVSPRAGLIYQPTAAISLYTSYSYTFLPSGQTLGLATNTAELTPENARNYEAGAKVDLLKRRLNLAGALFRLDRNNVKNTDPNDPTRLVLTGQQRTEGMTLTASGIVLPRWKIYGGYANLNARITADTSSAPAGRRVGLVPRSQFTLWSTYDLSESWGVGGGIVNQTKMYASFSNQVRLPGFIRVDGLAYYRIHGYRIALNLENLFNIRYYPTANGDNNISPGGPRTARFSVMTRF